MAGSGGFLLDTNIVIALFAGDDAVYGNIQEAARVFVPSIVLGELFFGAYRSVRAVDNAARVSVFAAEVPILPCDAITAERYGRTKQRLQAAGRPIP